jgi:hypothetical protein
VSLIAGVTVQGSRQQSDLGRPGPPRTLDHREIVAETLGAAADEAGSHPQVEPAGDRRAEEQSGGDPACVAAYGVRPWKA